MRDFQTLRHGVVAAFREQLSDVLHSTLRTAGMTFSGHPEDQSRGARMVGLKDPDGNNLYLLQKL